jgi:hypothetical protein
MIATSTRKKRLDDRLDANDYYGGLISHKSSQQSLGYRESLDFLANQDGPQH